MRTLTLIVDEAWNGSTVKHLLRARLHMAEGLIARVKLRETGLMRNGERVFINARLRTGDVLCVEIGDEGAVNEALPIAAPLTFVYEDEDIAVLNKSPDMAVHGSTGGQGCTVANALAALWGRDTAFHPVSRLDRGTSGIMVIAKSAYVHDLLRRMLHTDAFRREYLALARGAFPDDSGTVDLPIGRDEAAPTKRAVTPDGQSSRTEYTRACCCASARSRGARTRSAYTWRPSATRSLATLSTACRTICSPARPSTRRIFRSATPSPGKRWGSPLRCRTISKKRWRRSAAGKYTAPACRKHRQRGRCNYRKLIS